MRRSAAASSSHDAKASPGWNTTIMKGEQLARMKALAERAATTYPPSFVNKAYDGPLETPEGDAALERGRWANRHRKPAPRDSGSTGRIPPGFPSPRELDAELGGVDGYYTLCGLHYCNLFANPRMNVLFDTRDEDTAASALDHGKRIACTLLDECHGTRSFASLGRGFSGAFAVMGTHNKVRAPRRPRPGDSGARRSPRRPRPS